MYVHSLKNDRYGILNITAAGLTELPPEIGDLTNLAGLNRDDNQLTELPPEIWNLTNLVDWNRHARVFSELVG